MTDDHPETPPDESVEDAEARLRASGEPFVRATVVRREAPISATVGDRAIVTADGIQAGWIGGVGCAETAVLRESRTVLETGEPKLIGLAPEPESIERPGLEAFPLTCHSGGTLEVFVDPVNTAPRLAVVGGSAVAKAVAGGARDLGFHVTVVDPADGAHPAADEVVATTDQREIVEALDGVSAVVVASVGEFDARGIAAAVELDAAYVGLVASRRRAEEVFERAADLLGIEAADVADRVESPAGIDIDADRPAEIGVSILGELVAQRESLGPADGGAQASAEPETAIDPVCGMTVHVADAAATVEHDGETYYFCGQGCADAFAQAPTDHVEGP